jgi:hypothetical protein
LPEQLFFGKPRILDVCIVTGASIAKAREVHYHNPPGYLVIEPGDTLGRTRNLRQKNTTAHKFQGDAQQFAAAERVVAGWGDDPKVYRTTPEYQAKVRSLRNQFPYREETNFSKLDRIGHPGIEAFKKKVYETPIHGLTVGGWRALLGAPKKKKRSSKRKRRRGRVEDVTQRDDGQQGELFDSAEEVQRRADAEKASLLAEAEKDAKRAAEKEAELRLALEQHFDIRDVSVEKVIR